MRIRKLEIDDLTVRRLTVLDDGAPGREANPAKPPPYYE